MKGKKLLTALLTLAMGVSTAVGLASCDKSYNSEETDALIAQLQTTIDGNKTELNGKIAALEQGYKAKDNELQASILENTQALATLKTEYESKVAALEKVDADNATALATLKTDYESKVAALEQADADNATALTTLKTDYESKVAALEKVDADNATALATLKTDYESKVAALEQADADNATALATLKTDYENKVAALEKADKDNATALTTLKTEYESKVKALEQVDKDNASALAALKADYDEKVAELTKADNDNKQAIADLDTRYKAEVEKLTASNQANANALATLKTEYESKVAALEKADKDNATALANLKADYESKVADLQGKIDTANKTIADNKTALETAIATLKTTYDEKLNEVEALIDTIQSTDTTQDEKIIALQQQAADLITQLAEMEKATTIVSVAFNDDGDLVITFADGSTQIAQAPETHVHTFGEWISYNDYDWLECYNKIYSRTCSTCDTVEWKHGEHTLSEEIITVAPDDCRSDGYDYQECLTCGCMYTFNYVEAQPHTFVEEVGTYAPTCQYVGYDYKVCSECGYRDKFNYTDALGHAWSESIETHAPTCLYEGYEYHICLTCGVGQRFNYVDALGHSWSESIETYAPTCLYVGYDYQVCLTCGVGQRFNYVDALGHSWGEAYAYDAFAHWIECSACGYEKVGTAEDHTFVDGTCTVCNNPFSYTEGVVYDTSADGTYAEVIGYEGTATRVRIAGTYKNLPVKTIYDKAFYQNKSIVSVVIPDSVETIGDRAFYDCSRLASVVIGDSVTTIGDYAFYDCRRLASVVIGDSVTTIGDYAFQYCGLTSVVIGGSVTTIGDYAFYDCGLTSVEIPDSVETIGDRAFYDCSSLTSVVIGDSVTTIGDYAFCNCSSLTSVVIGDSVTTIGDGAFYGCKKLQYNVYDNCNYLGNEYNPYVALIAPVNKNLSQYTIHEDTKLIADKAFYNCERLARVYYEGAVSEWSGISIGSSNSYLTNATRYYYVENQADLPNDNGKYWHYDENGEVVVWESFFALNEAKEFLLGDMINKNVETNKSYTVINRLYSFYAEEYFDISWSVNVTEGVTIEEGTGDTDTVVIGELAEDTPYVLTATISDSQGKSVTVSFDRVALAKLELVPVAITAAPSENTAYKLYMYQVNKNQDLYFTGKMSGYYLQTTNKTYGVNVYVKAVAGKPGYFNLCYTDPDDNATTMYIGVKNYYNIGEWRYGILLASNTDVSASENMTFEFTYSEEYGTMIATLDGVKLGTDENTTETTTESFYLGSNAAYTTFDACLISNITDSDACVGKLVKMVDKSTIIVISGATKVVIADYADANSWANSTQYTSLQVGDVATVTVSGTATGSWGGNTGKYYENGENWRIYQNETPSIVITAAADKTIVAVKITYVIEYTGVLTQGTTNIASDEVVTVNANSITFSVSNTGTATNGQVRITAIEVLCE